MKPVTSKDATPAECAQADVLVEHYRELHPDRTHIQAALDRCNPADQIHLMRLYLKIHDNEQLRLRRDNVQPQMLPVPAPEPSELTSKFYPAAEPQPYRTGKGATSVLITPEHCPGCQGWRLVWLRRIEGERLVEWCAPCSVCNHDWRDRAYNAHATEHTNRTEDRS